MFERVRERHPSPLQRETGRQTFDTPGIPVDVSWTTFVPRQRSLLQPFQQDAIIFLNPWSLKYDAKSIVPLCQTLADKSRIQTYAIDTRAQDVVPDVQGHEAEAVRQFIEENGFTNVTIVGNSQGGQKGMDLVVRLQQQNPDITINGLALIDSIGYYDQSKPELVKGYAADMLHTQTRLIRPPGIKGRKNVRRQNMRYLADGISGNARDIAESGKSFPGRAKNELSELVRGSLQAANIEVPVVIIHGANDLISRVDKIIPPDALDLAIDNVLDQREAYLKKHIFPKSPRVRMVVGRDNGTHNMMYSRPESTANAILYFMDHMEYGLRKDAVEAEVEASHQRWITKHEGDDYGWEQNAFGNMDGLLGSNSFMRDLFINQQTGNKTHRELLQEETTGGFSELKLSQTPGEFFATIDKAAESLKIPPEYQTNLRSVEQAKALLKLYVELRAQGYNHADLAGTPR